jgi:uncharacterized protein YecA (UPF0149 family)
MSDDPNKLKAILLEEADTNTQKEFAKMLAEQCETAKREAEGHRCWMFIPSKTEYEKMSKYNQAPDYDKCPKCKSGRLVVEQRNWNMGVSLTLRCKWTQLGGCDFSEEIGDDW